MVSSWIKRKSIKIGRNWFTNRVTDDWNMLSCLVTSVKSIASLKGRVNRLCMMELVYETVPRVGQWAF